MGNIPTIVADFYNSESQAWNNTRHKAWQGWNRVWQVCSPNLGQQLNVLDLGCGNARFFHFLADKIRDTGMTANYYGLDISSKLINLARSNTKHQLDSKIKSNFAVLDLTAREKLESYLKTSGLKFNLIVAMALLHHFPDQQARLDLFTAIAPYLCENGYFVYTTWNWLSDPKSKKLIASQAPGENNYWLNWQGNAANNKQLRFVHAFTGAEEQELATCEGYRVIESFAADGKNAKLNHYFILQRDVKTS